MERRLHSPTALLTLVALLVAVTVNDCPAGPNQGGVLIVHARPDLVYSTGVTYCGQSGITACEEAVPRLDGAGPHIWYVLAAFPPDSSPRLSGVTFGITYDANVVFEGYGHCADFELPDGTWPASGTGTAMTWNSPNYGFVTELYWFAGYTYLDVPASFAPRQYPGGGGSNFADDSVPALIDPVAGYGSLGFNQPGANPCGSWPAHGACCLPNECRVGTENDCIMVGGVYWGDGTNCDPDPCTAAPLGTCCFDDGSCQLVREWQCSSIGGTFQGEETCDPSPCPQAGACCLVSIGECRMLVSDACARRHGDFHGEGVPCDPDPCPTGACCLVDAGCLVLSPYECRHQECASYLGDGTTCDPNPCHDVLGACCFQEGICIGCLSQLTCEENAGTWMGAGVPCEPEPCPPSVGCGTANPGLGHDDGTLTHQLDLGTSVLVRRDDRSCGEAVFNSDGSYELGVSWWHGGVEPPFFGALAECFPDVTGICAVDFDFIQIGGQNGQTMDVYVWNTSDDGCPGAVLCLRTGVDPGPVSYSEFSRHEIQLSCQVDGPCWVGFWPNWPGEEGGWFVGVDTDGYNGCSRTYVAPGSPYGSGWIPADIPFGPMHALGIGIEVAAPTPIERTTWGKLKSLYHSPSRDGR